MKQIHDTTLAQALKSRMLKMDLVSYGQVLKARMKEAHGFHQKMWQLDRCCLSIGFKHDYLKRKNARNIEARESLTRS